MKKEIADLVKISRFYGKQKDYALGGGGNTSYKDTRHLYVKASGYSLGDITEEGFAILDRKKLSGIMQKQYSQDIQEREKEVMADLLNSLAEGQKKRRPSVEASLHEIIQYDFVVHTHPHLVNGLLCANEAEQQVKELFGNVALFVPYTDPGYILSKTVHKFLDQYRSENGREPGIIFLQNHGVFIGADTIEEIKNTYESIRKKILTRIHHLIQIEPMEYRGPIEQILPILTTFLGEELCLKQDFNTLIAHFTKDLQSISRIEKPFIPDQIVYCKAYPLVIQLQPDMPISMESFHKSLDRYRNHHGFDPKIMIVEKGPVISIEKNEAAAQLTLDVFQDAMKISFYSNYFGGPHFMSDDQIRFIENWEAENYRRKISAGG